jgi:hypothetical protein
MNLLLSLDGNDITLILKRGRMIVDQLHWTDEYTLSEKLLPNIDLILKKNKLEKNDVKKIIAKITKTSGVTSARIVRTVVAAWKVGNELQ